MKLYSQHPKASTSINFEQKLIDSLIEIEDNIDVIIESGTYTGLGSTKMLADIFIKDIITIETNENFYLMAKENLKPYTYVECINGLSLNYNECINFILNDDYIKNHQNYDNIYIDNIDDPMESYRNEIIPSTNENVLINKIIENYDKKLLIVLDSAGGIGYLEFQKVIETMKDKSFYLLLDDINHIKHYRSYQDILKNKDFNILISDEFDGYLLCKYDPAC